LGCDPLLGSQEGAEKEKAELTEFLRQALHLELSEEKTLVTCAEEGFDFLGYRVVKEQAQRTGRWVGKLRIPKGRLTESTIFNSTTLRANNRSVQLA
jgi:hypothetical protein